MFTISLEKLHLKTGSTSNKAEFKRLVKKLSVTNDLPDDETFYDASKDAVIFKNRYFNPITESQAKARTEKNRISEHLKNGAKLPLKMQQKIDAIRNGGK